MTTTFRQYTEAEKRSQFDWLASCWSDTGDAVRELMLGLLAHESLTPACLAQAWESYRDAKHTADALESGELTWREYEPDLTCPERQQAVREHAAMQADEALGVLIHGTAQARGTGRSE